MKKTKLSRYAKNLGGEKESQNRFWSLVRDEATLKLFLQGWAIAETLKQRPFLHKTWPSPCVNDGQLSGSTGRVRKDR